MAIHINSAGEPGLCSAVNGRCPFGGMDVHFTTVEAARSAYETKQAGSFSAKSHLPNSKVSVSADERAALAGANSLGNLELDGTVRGSLSEALDFDHVLAKATDGSFYDNFNEIYGPDTSDIQDIDRTDVGGGWKLMTSGLTQQYGYKGPWLHDSEQIAGGVARAVAEGEPGYYVAVAGTGFLESDEEDYEQVDFGWGIAYKPFAPVTEGFYPAGDVKAPF